MPTTTTTTITTAAIEMAPKPRHVDREVPPPPPPTPVREDEELPNWFPPPGHRTTITPELIEYQRALEHASLPPP
jgi:hypothetical protein